MNKFSITLLAFITLALGFGVGVFYSNKHMPTIKEKPQDSVDEQEVLFWRNPMNPVITSPVFMKDEMGMDYLPVYADGALGNELPSGTVSIDPTTVQNIGVRTTKAVRQTLSQEINALGRVTFNEERMARLHPKTSGWIESMNVDETGATVGRDSILLNIYSPDLVAAQREYLLALNTWERSKNSTSKSVLNSARERLELFDVPEHQIVELEQSRRVKKQLHIHSPFQGTVMNIGVRDGQYVTPKDQLYLIADLNRIWVNVDVFEDQLSWVKVGDRAQMRVRAAPGRVYEGQITFIHPVLNSNSRTAQVRLEFDNSDLSLKPGMFSNVVLFTNPQQNIVVIPDEAIVRSGSREQVFVVREPGKFEPREVTLGISADGLVQIVKGVNEGEYVVTSSQFLIDSESKLREATAKMMQRMSHDKNLMTEDVSMDGMSMDELDMSESNSKIVLNFLSTSSSRPL